MTIPTFKNEREFLNAVRAEARKRGWALIHHESTSFGTKPGFPDLLLVHGGKVTQGKKQTYHEPKHGILFLELKTGKRKTTEYQQAWIAGLQAAGQKAYIVRPEQWHQILALLDGEAVDLAGTGQLALEAA